MKDNYEPELYISIDKDGCLELENEAGGMGFGQKNTKKIYNKLKKYFEKEDLK